MRYRKGDSERSSLFTRRALLLGGAVLTETTFNWPGLGHKLLEYIEVRDYIAVQGIITFFAIIVVITSVVIDVVIALIDPRVRYQ